MEWIVKLRVEFFIIDVDIFSISNLYSKLKLRMRLSIVLKMRIFKNSREVIFAKSVRVLDRQIFRLVRMKKRNRRFTRTT